MIKALVSTTLLVWLAIGASAQTTREVAAFDRALVAMRDGSWPAALRTAEGIGPTARDVVEWHRLRAGQGDFDSVQRFLQRRGDWPGLELLRRRSERALPFGARADDVIAYFETQSPQTGAGSVALISAYRASDMGSDAEAEAVRAWLTHLLSAADEMALMGWYGDQLKPHHWDRLDMLLWRDAKTAAKRMYPRVSKGQVALAKARLALRARKKRVDGLVKAVPKSLTEDPGLLFERMQWRARKGKNASAVELMLAQSPDKLGRPEYWSGWRRSLARAEMRAGRISNAYNLASRHGLDQGSHFADLEWLSGYLALTYREDGDAALKHFLRFRGAVETPISLGRAGYWEGRAHELSGDSEAANLAYAFGAEYQTSFYGLLAAEKAGRPMDPELAASVTKANWRGTSFADSTVFEASRLFIAAGEIALAKRFLTHLSESLTKADIARLGAFVLEQHQPHLAVMIGKRAAKRGIVVPFAYYPVADLGVPNIPVPQELALAIARRESEFDPAVMSGVGARGLMQVMPATAKAVAKFLEIPYSRERLIADPAYNVRIGTAYLDELMSLFNGNIVMVSAGYNAGPGRPIRWMDQLGDPRRGAADIIDWIEHIPFDETRNYVMRVAESLPVYRARLSGQTSEFSFSSELVAMVGYTRTAEKGVIMRPRARPA
ncbi:MAG: lytic transglycosylase domain-containing protein, partial [Boseongicola sp.]